jgi:hypothetical protein
MGLLNKVFKSKTEAPAKEPVEPACPHVTLVPRWDNAADMGITAKATSYVCEGCKQTFSAAEAGRLLASEEERLSEIISDEPQSQS